MRPACPKKQPSAPRARSPPFALCACAVALGCQPALPYPSGSGPGEAPAEPHALLEPDAPFGAAPRVVRVRIVPEEGGATDPSRLLFVRGHVGDGHVRQVEHADISNALAERALPALVWSDDDGSAILAPTDPLDPGATYGVLSGDPPLGIDVRPVREDPVPLLTHVWPPPATPESGPFAIFCDTGHPPEDPPGGLAPDLPAPPDRLALSPGDIEATATLGASPTMPGPCLRMDVLTPQSSVPPSGSAQAASSAASSSPDVASDPDAQAPRALPPPVLTLADGSLVRLHPAPISLTLPAAPPPTPTLACEAPALPFGPGCALVADDRLFIATPDAPLFWAVRSSPPAAGAPPTTAVHTTDAGQPFVLRGFSPSSSIDLTILALDASGRPQTGALVTTTQPPLPHVVISEVLANPLGVEPDQEWIELYNDGLAPADLSSYSIVDIGGDTPLPAATLPPGAFALVVNEPFVEDDELGPPPAPGTLVLRVPKLGKDGLKNDGEPLKLRAPDGTIVSRFPAAPKPKAGHGVTRITPSSPDGDPTSFLVAPPTPGAPYSAGP